MKKTPKKRQAQDTTLINLRAMKRRQQATDAALAAVTANLALAWEAIRALQAGQIPHGPEPEPPA
jgi:hypothetical protein